jgi:hypothetical protein
MVFQNGSWYESSWYNGPWYAVAPDSVPLYLLRVPVRYYRHPPAFFHGWRADAPPHWGEHWGHGWEERHHDWNHWDRRHAPGPAPLPSYQRRYSGERYPRNEAQAREHMREYHYQPRDRAVREHYERHYDAHWNAPHEQRAPENRGHDNRGHENHGHESRGPDNHGHENHGHEDRGHDDRGHDNRGHEGR